MTTKILFYPSNRNNSATYQFGNAGHPSPWTARIRLAAGNLQADRHVHCHIRPPLHPIAHDNLHYRNSFVLLADFTGLVAPPSLTIDNEHAHHLDALRQAPRLNRLHNASVKDRNGTETSTKGTARHEPAEAPLQSPLTSAQDTLRDEPSAMLVPSDCWTLARPMNSCFTSSLLRPQTSQNKSGVTISKATTHRESEPPSKKRHSRATTKKKNRARNVPVYLTAAQTR